MISPATSTPVAVSMPSSPGEEFTSMTTGPRSARSRSTPATANPMTLAARMAVFFSARDIHGDDFAVSQGNALRW